VSQGKDHTNPPPGDVRLHARAMAKINLALAVGAPIHRGDPGAGMHPIASWMHCIELWDDLDIRSRSDVDAAGVDLKISWAPDAPRPSPLDWQPAADLAVRAHARLAAHTAHHFPASISITKRVPVGGGLGGGSSDAAATMLACNDLFDLGLTGSQLVRLSASVGSDVAFFLDEAEATPRPALVTGLGERIERLPRSDAPLILILPPFGCNTGAVYRAFDQLGPARLREEEIAGLAGQGVVPGQSADLFNDLAAAAEIVEPRLGDLRRHCQSLVERPVHITGSGSTLFALADDPDHAASMVAWLREQRPGLSVLASRLV
jgi:4-diphosphocytidyl-2-C-methyl-D-erythritol kinase